MQPRPPIVAILGHVDHGKTTLLDYLRKSRLASKEHGGITQRIGAYEVTTNFKDYKVNKITFIDTPGHEAFSQLRARGATIADIALLVIDAKDSVMPQTAESISHIKAAKIPYIVVINKIDLSDANPDKVKNDLLKYEVVVEGKGGTVPVSLISASVGTGISELLEHILLIADDAGFAFEKDHEPKAFIIETKKDRRGIVASAIIKDGTLRIKDTVYVNDKQAKIRSLIDDLGKSVSSVSPSQPFELLGFEEMPDVGSELTTTKKEIVVEPQIEDVKNQGPPDPAKLFATAVVEKKLSLVIKADSHGSLEAILNSLIKKVNIEIILKGVGDINKSDVFLAKATKAIVIGFATNISPEVKSLSQQEKVIIKTYNIIYELLEELEEVADLLTEKEIAEKNIKAEAKVLATFVIEGEKVYGVKITKGKVNLGDLVEIHRNDNLIGKSKLVSLKVRAKSVSEVRKEQEAGMVFGPQLDIRMGDVIKYIS